jgi:hypothetical protein
MILEHLGIDHERFRVQWISAAESIRFVEAITVFDNHIRDIGLLGQKENLNLKKLQHKLRAALMSVETKMLRMIFAKQAKQMKENGTYGEFPSKEKLMETFKNEMGLHETLLYLKEKERSVLEISDLLEIPGEEVASYIETLKKRNLWSVELREA